MTRNCSELLYPSTEDVNELAGSSSLCEEGQLKEEKEERINSQEQMMIDGPEELQDKGSHKKEAGVIRRFLGKGSRRAKSPKTEPVTSLLAHHVIAEN